MIEVKQAEQITNEVVEAFSRLIPQLDPKSGVPRKEDLEAIINTSNTYLFLAYNPNIVGTLTLAVVQTPSGTKAWIEDVVVDISARGQRVGESLLNHAVDFASGLDVSSINLTSNPARVAANNLYRKIGFELRDTNVYRITV
ncbi:GNAT family N-acetyltransferase [Dysgonomonas sp. 521]|uniref:GNAT family N-acetyltransferase n=1 Tax=Dysgonomonas sp. 521 TaxID=2302932 RepID=UPI0013D053FD|nr:GNAT family N-acetyltransferase [Dysgonomonas sp. 521]NDV96042.1 GNAT family N-acetyltransferase [Dysgonomonas sp. 521]